MRTTKPISTISYNSPEYLYTKLSELRKCGLISFWCFIQHWAEDDEANKDHFHVYIEPSKIVQTDDIRDFFKEFDPSNPSKPLGCIQFNSSKFDPWYMYCLHDKRYLASLGESRKYHYSADEFVASDDDDLLFKVKRIDMLNLSRYADMEDAIEHGLSWSEYFARGTVPIQQINNFERAWYLLTANRTERNGHQGHEELKPSESEKNSPSLNVSESANMKDISADEIDLGEFFE